MQGLVLGEALIVAVGGLLTGLVVGIGMGLLLVQVLEPLFVLAPVPVAPITDALVLVALVLGATTLSSALALIMLRRLRPSEVLREQ